MFNIQLYVNFFAILFNLFIAKFVLQSCALCVQKELYNNLSMIFPNIGLEYVNIFSKTRENLVKDCPNVQPLCCTKYVFNVFNILFDQILHNMSGLKDIHESIGDLNQNIKSTLLTIINTFIRQIHLSVIRLNKSQFNITNFYQLFHMELRLKLINEEHSIDLKSIFGKSNNKIPAEIDQFIGNFNDATERNILIFYRLSSNLLSITQQMQEIPPSNKCKKTLIHMTLCGICSQNLDWTPYFNENTMHFNNKICPKYCHNVIKNCMAYYSALIEPLKSFQIVFNNFISKHTFDIEEYSHFWINKNTENISILKMALISSEKNEDPTTMSRDIESKLDEDKYLQDNVDSDAAKYFFNCIKLSQCKSLKETNIKQFNGKLFKLVKTFKRYIETLIKPDSFINKILAKKCNNSNFSFCWNGFEIGQFHDKIINFPPWSGEESQILGKYPSKQRIPLQKLIRDIKETIIILKKKTDSYRNRFPSVNEAFSPVDGSGQNKDYEADDDVDDDKIKFSTSLAPPSFQIVTIPNNDVKDSINIKYPLSNTSAIISQFSKNNTNKIRTRSILLFIYVIYIGNYFIL